MSVFLPLLDNEADDELVAALSRIGPVAIPGLPNTPDDAHTEYTNRYILLDHDTSVDLEQLIAWLDHGAQKVIVPLSWASELIGLLPASRILLLLDVASASAVSEKVRNGVSGVLLKSPSLELDLISSISRFFTGKAIHVLSISAGLPSPSTIRGLKGVGATLVIPSSQLTIGPSDATHLNVADAFLAPVTSDRPDGLFPTVVSSHLQSGRSLGLVYSSTESVKESIITGRGVYQSRKHGLWRKGETSGATQDVVRIRLDCDEDCLEFSVVQHGAGFCHLERTSCFGEIGGLAALEETLRSRRAEAPEGSYTRRLFEDEGLLRSKIMEEADELCRAETKKDVAFEAADLIYFALTKCVAAGVGIADIESSLEAKARKVTRRPGNAKPQFSAAAASTSTSTSNADKPLPAPPAATATPPQDPDAPIRMRSYDLSTVTPSERVQLLLRPVLAFDEMIAKVKPIVDSVRTGGDAALLSLTAKFDKAQLESTVLFPPYPPESMVLEDSVRQAIDVAYANVYKFHAAQAEDAALVVETMPGVVCSRFARPIARVGLYVPGGTAILPSTALMLGIPAQVAGCKEIVLATPPRPDGSISPEVMYVAHLVGASAVLKAGGGQAVAAMAYGTETVPKVDKIFGPGNQWVTAAKMLVQNDTAALVSIDMPAGPSEVLVIADHTCNPAFVAADLLSQAEHGIDSQVVLVSVSLPPSTLDAIEHEVDAQARALPRLDIMRQSVAKSIIVRTESVEEAMKFSNEYAPEHLILHLEGAGERVRMVENAGSVFVGPYSPESCGDYASGTNHTLPTNGYARQFSGVNTLSFQKHITSQELTAQGLKNLGPVVATLADCEGLGAHANAVRIRLAAGI
ncbi:histidine biosynthesis trifunctional-protein [Stereum hirsutum FP-91666 SS1]|uniref:histidine biosynthesis trifunctional-protein n=1 Tax=Stereum hirsutum (strain FP-91666) TaxID=721885 RepID=UPI000440A0A5|nr:histidine biosynthesis trifunctional-protein [Stereum hirsutum FP-91666 SS1]EIM88071.1 histidine biosynthesis trifunctional-protein [Stereum hirsutum FP-91666 SS1]